ALRLGVIPAILVGVLGFGLVALDQRLVPADGREEYRAAWHSTRIPLAEARARQEKLTEIIRKYPAARFVYVFPSDASDRWRVQEDQLEAMWACQELGIPCANGYTGHFPAGHEFFAGYRSLLHWLKDERGLSDEELAGMVLINEPVPDRDPEFDRRM